jgi:hypothetical protein
MNESRLLLAGVWLSLVAVGAVGCSSTPLEEGSTSTNGDRTKTAGVSSAAPGALAPTEAIIGPAVRNAGRPNLPGVQQPLYEAPPPPASVLAERTKAIIASTPAVAAPAVKQAQLPPSAASLPAVAPEVIAQQDRYLKEWEQLQPTVASLPLEEQERQRAALKQAILGK